MSEEQMSAAEFRAVREHLGLTVEWAAKHLDVTDRTIRSWETGRHRVPAGVRDELEHWQDQAAAAVDQVVDTAMDAPDPVVRVPLRDEDAPAPWPARWWRQVAMRAVDEVPGLRLAYDEPPGPTAT